MREKIRVPQKAYDELVALNREIHFTTDFAEIVRKAEDRGYKSAVEWLKAHEQEYKIGFAWGFEPIPEPTPVARDTGNLSPPPKRASAAPAKQAPPQKNAGGFFGKITRVFRK